MSDLQLITYDDAQVSQWYPLVLTRPAGELIFGAYRQRARAEYVFGARCLGHLTDPALAGFEEPEARSPIGADRIDPSSPRLFLSSRAVPAGSVHFPAQRTALRMGADIIGFFCPAGSPAPAPEELLRADADLAFEIPGSVLHNVWELVSRHLQQLQSDLDASFSASPAAVPAGVQVIGEPRLILEGTATIEPGVVLDFREGAIRLAKGVEVRAFTRLAGPASVGAHSVLLGGSLTGVTIGAHCKVRGEVEASVILDYSNKAHDGFLGHSYVGSWVNLGALTTNSDLKNNYGSVRLWTPGGEADTGEMKIGCFLADHVKTAIGTMINTGTVVGPGSNLFGGMPPKYVPPFSWGVQLGEHEFEKFIGTARTAMQRRSVPLTSGHQQMLRAAWQRGRRLHTTVQA